jgi:AraC-like DNA-binding protein
MNARTSLEYSHLIRETLLRLVKAENSPALKVHMPRSGGHWQHLPGHIFHVCHELFVQISGLCQFHFPEEELILYPGDMLLIPPGLPHQECGLRHGTEPFCNLLVTIGEHYLDTHIAECPEDGPNRHIPVPVHPEKITSAHQVLYCHLLQALETANFPDAKQEHLFQLRSLQALASLLLHDLGVARTVMSDLNSAAKPEHHKVTQAKLIINRSELTDSLSVGEIARRIGCSANYLSTLFRRETGEPLKTYLNQTRLERARDMLLQSPRTISEIAWLYGFRDAGYFSRLFARTFGCSPKEYRRQLN